MAKAYSLDLRRRAFEAWQAGEGTQAQVAARFKLSASCLRDLARRFRESGDVAAKAHGGGRRPLLPPAGQEHLAGLVTARADDTIQEHRLNLAAGGFVLSHTTTSRALLALGLTRKKRLRATTKPKASG
jgi:transposase